MLTAKKNDTIQFNKGKIRFLVTDKNKNIVENYGPSIMCGSTTVGIRRFFEAKQAGLSADLVIQIPPVFASLTSKDLLEFESYGHKGKHICRIIQVQDRYDSAPPCLQLTLQEEKTPYVDKRET